MPREDGRNIEPPQRRKRSVDGASRRNAQVVQLWISPRRCASGEEMGHHGRKKRSNRNRPQAGDQRRWCHCGHESARSERRALLGARKRVFIVPVHDKRGEQSARHATTTTRDTRDEVRGQRRAAHGDATLIRDVSPLVLFGLFMHACMGGVARPPAYTARRAGAPTAQQLCLPWKTTNLALTR